MTFFLLISFVAGILTVLAPCILPLLPVIIGGSVVSGSSKRAYTVIGSLIVSLVVFTLLIKVSSVFLNVPQEAWQYISGGIIFLLGISMIVPTLWERLTFIQKLSASSNQVLGKGLVKETFTGDIIMGAALGPVFSTCSPTYFIILATVLPVNFLLGLLYLFAYAIGLGIALVSISLFGQKFANSLAITFDTHGSFRKWIGLLFILVALAIVTGFDKKIESRITGSGFFDVTKVEQKLLQANGGKQDVYTKTAEGLPSLGRYSEITDPQGFVNTNGKPIKLSDYIGKKIIVIDFLTYSCINCQRTFPYLVDWNTKYSDKGLLIVGIHTPEFAFEKVQANVETAMKKEGITFPIVLDNNYGTWNAYKNQYWPRKYIIDLDGNIVFDHIGEGNYQETEEVIKKLLMTIPGNTSVSGIQTKDVDASLTPSRNSSLETYLGYSRMDYNANTIPSTCHNIDCTFISPQTLSKNTFAFGGTWNIQDEKALGGVGSTITYHTQAKKVHLVAGAKNSSESVVLEVYVNGIKSKEMTINMSDIYTLFEGSLSGEQTVMIKVIKGSLEVYTFTFS